MEKYYTILIRWCWFAILTAALAAGSVYAYFEYAVERRYEANSGIYIVKDSVDAKNNRVLAYYDLLGAELVATDCKSIIPSKTLLSKAAVELDLPLYVVDNGFAVRNGGSARVIVVSSTGVDPERAKIIVESVVTTFLEESADYFPGVTFKRLDDIRVSPVKSMAPIYMAGAALVGACFSIGCILLISAIRSRPKAKPRPIDTLVQ